ncbi:hypothetical protein [Algicella marina]|uniref:FTP domain-containing protein n=1 Tax=Algicella marina TaxID=2683284 RepID=A0A6P1T126_9RHOB|nr:hypothetical protein [Algicella marina]QHQ34232.1 hypothetical protein GO499_03010 [Algicella marina]
MSETIIRNKYGEVEHMTFDAPMAVPDGFAGASPTIMANWALKELMGQMGLEKTRMDSDPAAEDAKRADEPILRMVKEKPLPGTMMVVYEQEAMGMPVFGAKVGIRIAEETKAVTSLQSSVHAGIDVQNPKAKSAREPMDGIAKTTLKKMIGATPDKAENGRVRRQVIYRYEPDERVEEPHREEGGCFGRDHALPLKLAAVPKGIEAGKHYIADEILFEAPYSEAGHTANWRALVEPETGAVLYIRALVGGATGMVYDRDPQTQTGTALGPDASDAQLNPFRTSVTLQGLTAATPQPLAGEFVSVQETRDPVVAAPEAAGPGGTFNFNVTTDDFAAVNAYFSMDRCYRTVQDFGFDIPTYFAGTTFPVPVDHRGEFGGRNAHAWSNGTGDGMGHYTFGLVETGEPVGISTSNRVCWHEFGHALLYESVGGPNFGFAHSAGDSMAAISNDPGTAAPDRGLTFPWVDAGSGFTRRHDRTVAAGWGWFGSQYGSGYDGEQVLSSTLFRLYRSYGGDSGNVNRQREASNYVMNLIFGGCGALTSTTSNPEVFEAAMEDFERNIPMFNGIPGGHLHKVIRWSFEQQGLFQPLAAPGTPGNVTTVGNPPDVDVYIDDGRNGEYEWQANHWSCQDMWVRRSADGGLTHEQPIVGQTNYMYVRVKNRGTQTANGVSVDAYHCIPGTGLAFPDDWMPMATATLGLPAIASGGEDIAGPFAFVPTEVGHECLLAIARADGDEGNDTTINGTIPESRLVPFDNNIGQRNVNPILPSFRRIVEWWREHVIIVRNPFCDPRIARIDIILPQFLRRLGWQMRVVSEGGPKFRLEEGARNKVYFQMEPGKDFSDDLVRRAIKEGDAEIRIEVWLDGELSGGMSYPLSFDAGDDGKDPDGGRDPIKPVLTGNTIRDILGVLRGGTALPGGTISEAGGVRRLRIEFDLDDDET